MVGVRSERKSRVVVLGAPGYTGMELVRLLAFHPHTTIVSLASHSRHSSPFEDTFPSLQTIKEALPPLVYSDEIVWDDVDIAFCALPHGVSQDIVGKIPQSVRIIDLSADFRLSNPADYHHWYGRKHAYPTLLKDAVYGLSEHDDVADARLVACPGCYPTGILLGLLPLLKAGCIEQEDIIIDAKSGVSGAGRSLKETNSFCAISEGMRPYALKGHRHLPEIKEQMEKRCVGGVDVHFVPHLIPINRTEMINAYVRPKASFSAIFSCLQEMYHNKPFVHVFSGDNISDTRCVRGTNACFLWLVPLGEKRLMLVSFIDNLLKGAAGQAIQNYNLMCGYDETDGLPLSVSLYP